MQGKIKVLDVNDGKKSLMESSILNAWDSNFKLKTESNNNLNAANDTQLHLIREKTEKNENYFKKKEAARKRWKLLASVLLKKQIPRCRVLKTRSDFAQNFTIFDLIKPITPETSETINGCWFQCCTEIFGTVYQVKIHHLEQNLTLKELTGYNNTGNIRIWPSEEALAYYLLSNINFFERKRILEVGGGMTCLAGLMLARYGKVNHVDLTDGNSVSVKNVNDIIEENQMNTNKVKAFQLDWLSYRHLTKTYDVVLSSDCLFFDETREGLIETIWHSLNENGLAFIMAPKRGNTLDLFLKMSTLRGFHCLLENYYNEAIWQKHMNFKKSIPDYNENLHYPLLLLLSKSNFEYSLVRQSLELTSTF